MSYAKWPPPAKWGKIQKLARWAVDPTDSTNPNAARSSTLTPLNPPASGGNLTPQPPLRNGEGERVEVGATPSPLAGRVNARSADEAIARSASIAQRGPGPGR